MCFLSSEKKDDNFVLLRERAIQTNLLVCTQHDAFVPSTFTPLAAGDTANSTETGSEALAYSNKLMTRLYRRNQARIEAGLIFMWNTPNATARISMPPANGFTTHQQHRAEGRTELTSNQGLAFSFLVLLTFPPATSVRKARSSLPVLLFPGRGWRYLAISPLG